MIALARITMLFAIVLLISTSPAAAIHGGQLDDGDPPAHPVVGTFYWWYEEGGEVLIERGGCTGSLIAPNVVLTVAHCAGFFKHWVNQGYSLYVTFNWDSLCPPQQWRCLDEGQSGDLVGVTSIHVNPAYVGSRAGYGLGNPFNQDIAVMMLAEPQNHLEIPPLPTVGLLDELAAQNGLKDAAFTTVGYGYDVEFGAGAPSWTWADQRSWAVSVYRAITPYYLVLSGNEALGLGGICSGDSGGPNYLTIDNVPVLVAVTAQGDGTCMNLNVPYRLDTEAAREFLGTFQEVHLP